MSARDDVEALLPQFEISVNGQALPEQARADVISVSVLDDVDGAGMFTVVLPCWDAAAMQAKWLDDDLFREGNPVQIALGYGNAKKVPLIAGEITALEVDFPHGRPPKLTVRGHDLRHRLTRARRTRTYTNCKDSDIASRLAREAGLDAKVENSEVTLPYVLQHNQTDLEFLKERALRIGWEAGVDGRALLFRKRKIDGKEVATLRRAEELLEFRIRLSTFGQVPRLEVRAWDPQAKREWVGRASSGDEGKLMGGTSRNGPGEARRAFETQPSARVDMPVHSQAEADQLAKRAFAEMALHYVRAQGMCAGDARLRAGEVVNIEGIGERFSGPYYLRAVEHRFGPPGGYRTVFSATRNAA